MSPSLQPEILVDAGWWSHWHMMGFVMFLMWFSLCLSVILLRSVSCVFTIKIGIRIALKVWVCVVLTMGLIT